jgi:hypothetical protein
MRWISMVELWAQSRAFQRRIALGLVATAILLVLLAPTLCWACACGCGVFEVGTASLFPRSGGGTFWLEYDFMDQYLNWHATQIASAANNGDKVLRTHFMTAGAQYMFNRNWGAMIEVPYWVRYFKTTNDAGNNGEHLQFDR